MRDFKADALPCFSIAVAVIRQNGRYLIGQRPENKPQGGYWEFAGGKLEPGESVQQALIRECLEELGIVVRPTALLLTTEHQYPDRRVILYFWDTALIKGTPKALAHQRLAWVTDDELEKYPFCPANRNILALLKNIGPKADDG